jgi:hypothetical protein
LQTKYKVGDILVIDNLYNYNTHWKKGDIIQVIDLTDPLLKEMDWYHYKRILPEYKFIFKVISAQNHVENECYMSIDDSVYKKCHGYQSPLWKVLNGETYE